MTKKEIINLIQKYGDLREKYGSNKSIMFDFEKDELNQEIGFTLGQIINQLNDLK